MKTFDYLIAVYEKNLYGRGLMKGTILSKMFAASAFLEYVQNEKGKDAITDITTSDITDFVKHLQESESRRCRPYSPGTVRKRLSDIKTFFRFLYRNEYILVDPMETFMLQIKVITKKKEIFTLDEMNAFLDSIDVNTTHGMRNRAIFELMYSSGLRVNEVVNIDLHDLDLGERILTVREGKGRKDRFVPFSDTADLFLKKYIKGERNKMISRRRYREKSAFFLSVEGRIKHWTIREVFDKIILGLGMKRENLTPHSIRHSTATHLLEAGADVRYVQELLGHENIETTVKYTHLMLDNLKKAYKSAHPRENDYYEEIDDEYLQNVKKLKDDIMNDREWRKKYDKDE